MFASSLKVMMVAEIFIRFATREMKIVGTAGFTLTIANRKSQMHSGVPHKEQGKDLGGVNRQIRSTKPHENARNRWPTSCDFVSFRGSVFRFSLLFHHSFSCR